MVNLREKPYYLSDEDIAWVKNTIKGMSDEEKVGQLFFQLTASQDENYLRELMEKYHLGGCRYNGMPGAKVLEQNKILQKYAKVPVFIACNPEKGGDGVCPDGTFVSSGIKVGATGKSEYAYAMGEVSGAQIAGAGIADTIHGQLCTGDLRHGNLEGIQTGFHAKASNIIPDIIGAAQLLRGAAGADVGIVFQNYHQFIGDHDTASFSQTL